MYLESFRHLIEIEALKKANQQNFNEIDAQKKRISALESKKAKFTEEITQFKQDILALKLTEREAQIEVLRNQITKLNDQMLMIKTLREQTALEEQIKDLSLKADQDEEEYFLNLEVSENLILRISDHQQFLKGSENTVLEITAEAEIIILAQEKLVRDRELRIDSLLSQCLDDVKSLYARVEKQLAPKKHTSFLINKKCNECHMQIDSMLKNNIENGVSLEVCPHCARLLIPETSRIY